MQEGIVTNIVCHLTARVELGLAQFELGLAQFERPGRQFARPGKAMWIRR